MIGNITGGLVGPLVNFRAIQAQYLTANARQLQALYSYQRVILEAVTDVVNRISKVDNYAKSIEIRKQQVTALETAVEDATSLYRNPRAGVPIDYLDVLTAQNALFDAIKDLIDTKGEQLAAVANTYQALGGGLPPILLAGTAVNLTAAAAPFRAACGGAAARAPAAPARVSAPARDAPAWTVPAWTAPAWTADLAWAGKPTGPGKAIDESRAAASTTVNIESFMGSITCLSSEGHSRQS